MFLNKKQQFHFIGCGGAGMAPLARIMQLKGFKVSGSDIAKNANTKGLESIGVQVFDKHSEKNISNLDDIVIVYSSAISAENPELSFAKNAGWKTILRGVFLAELAKTYKRTVSISGSHGKTTVTAMLAHILKECNMNPGFMIGGKISGWEFSSEAGNSDIFITEADESDGTHALLYSHLGIVNNIESDHAWSVGGEEQLYLNFQNFSKQSDKLIFVESEKANKLLSFHSNFQKLPNKITKNTFSEINNKRLKEWGEYQKINANIAITAAEHLGVNRSDAETAMNDFCGVARRMTLHYDKNEQIIIEDYAHHPTEVKVAISALRERYSDYKLKVVFQPHRYARLKLYFDEFACELRKADEIFVTPVFAAWVEKGELDSHSLADKIGDKATAIDGSWQEIAEELKKDFKAKEVLAIFGAGDIINIFKYLK